MSIEAFIFYIIFIDAIVSNVIAWGGFGAKLEQKYTLFSRFFPLKRGWTTYYLVLILWIGWTLFRLAII